MVKSIIIKFFGIVHILTTNIALNMIINRIFKRNFGFRLLATESCPNHGVLKLPRIFLDVPNISVGSIYDVDPEVSHYLCTVLRKTTGEIVRIFDG